MKPAKFTSLTFCLFLFISCSQGDKEETANNVSIGEDTKQVQLDEPIISWPAAVPVVTQNVQPQDIVNFAKTLVGVPYQYGATDPAIGFDCSGFITHVFNHFNIQVPRSSVDFTNVGTEVETTDAVAGDLILFTGTDSTSTVVGHMGIVTENTDSLRFIHSTSGRAYGVTVTALNKSYSRRFVKVIRIF